MNQTDNFSKEVQVVYKHEKILNISSYKENARH
jgi:hypothetical protein